MGSRILPTSHRTQEILQQIGTLEERMQRRKESLHEAKATVEKQLSEINRRLEKMKKS
jgi:predicted  nucleic acid-binding Zn-ribbon protein